MPKKPVLFVTIADEKNFPLAKELERSFKKFHPDIPFHIVQGEELQVYLKTDPMFFYRATPILGEKYLKEYELVVKVDSDSLVLDDISYIWKTNDYDIAVPLNWNRFDIQHFPIVQGWGILPIEYVNCGFVAMRNAKFVHDWKVWCFSPQFDRLPFKEQDGLNILIYHGNWNIRILDHMDPIGGNDGVWGLFLKGEWNRSELRGEKIIVPKGFGDTPFPPKDIVLKVVHLAGGSPKMQWSVFFPEKVMERINYLKSEVK